MFKLWLAFAPIVVFFFLYFKNIQTKKNPSFIELLRFAYFSFVKYNIFLQCLGNLQRFNSVHNTRALLNILFNIVLVSIETFSYDLLLGTYDHSIVINIFINSSNVKSWYFLNAFSIKISLFRNKNIYFDI